MLTNPKSRLTGMDISDVINYGAWLALSPESRASLCKLLPRTAFGEQSQELDESHPSRRSLQENISSTPYKIDDSVQTDQPAGSLDELAPVQEQHLDPSFFKDPHFESAARTFQDHLFSGWFTPAHRELVERHHLGVRDGSLYAPWKDDLWDQDHPEDHNEADEEGSMQDPSDSIGTRNERRKSKESELSPLVRKGFLKQGDVISFRHKFLGCGLAIEKDALISAIHPKTSALTLTASSGTTRDLPSALLIPNPNGPADLSSLREVHVSTPTQLVTALLDIDGRIPREHRPRINAWKMITNWQWSVEMESQGISPEEAMLLDKGGRECLGTLFYLRGQALDD
ncbi:uncharacterized protein FOMMEDRAFT_127124 [Fomitiporia mediterranea MF3/22]|uniref:uncharacterized protein n=1 Tax=Fomitiporia mediterranea (strain MF3/22) TaxID=694068 RepID=UPI00044080C4|nr:uncharacterized protein FOMMEDRAFT_127124 [Fomitiporia mediterranea MF3/22]EJD00461.1 hypothetical protein FOMMEDRAFT_127124 [Fomitiporia mediterranea MF3/22]